MRTTFKSLLPPMVFAAGILIASAVSLLSARSWVWAMAGPVLLGVFIIAAKALSNRLLARADSYRVAILMAIAVVLASAIVAFSDLSDVKLLLPVLGASAAVTLTPQGRARCSRVSSV
ncbi:MAG TPA: hypothetical protein VF787_00035 [Thermoanaerobaculia bacterium]